MTTWQLTDVADDHDHGPLQISPADLSFALPENWSVTRRTLRGGFRDGVDVVEVHNGALAFTVLPTRGMGLWRGDYRGTRLGWHSPVVGPVHPAWVRPSDRGGIGWLDGFDEWLCRCGLISNGPPGEDQWTDERGQSRRETLTLHGPIANTPAHRLELTIDPQPPHALSLTGVVDEGGFFRQRLRLTVTYRTEPGSSRLSIHDTVENLGGSPAQMQMLYHCNFGPPLLGPGSRFAVAAREVAPLTARAAEGIDQYDTYLPPTAGYAEQNYAFLPATLPDGQAAALLHPAAADRGVLIRWHPDELPCFTVWKNTMSEAEGYVTGLEPATNFPNFRAFERERGRVRLLQPGERWQARWSIELLDTAATVAAHRSMIEEVLRSATIHRSPQGLFSKG